MADVNAVLLPVWVESMFFACIVLSTIEDQGADESILIERLGKHRYLLW